MIEEKAEQFRHTYRSIRKQIQKRMVGLEEVIDRAIGALFLGGHVLLEGVPGLGKTLLVRSLAESVDLNYSRIQFTPDLMPADIIGTNILLQSAEGQKAFRFQKGPLFTHVLLADEINRATPKTQSALLEAMQEHGITVSGQRYQLEEPFIVLATQNPIEMEGTYPLPEAQLDRFLYKVLVPYPAEEELLTILNRTTTEEVIRLEPVVGREKIREFASLIYQVPAAENALKFAAQLTLKTHPEHPQAPDFIRKYVRYGSSPRGAQALILSAKISALLQGRFNVAIEDITEAALPSLRHRILLNIEGQAENISTDFLITELLKSK
ncbi:AAA family ATPase [bacterium]|nr:AAA family ATPase [bacterium]MCI0606142.1 AAA family ATPase [bacterium]